MIVLTWTQYEKGGRMQKAGTGSELVIVSYCGAPSPTYVSQNGCTTVAHNLEKFCLSRQNLERSVFVTFTQSPK